MCTPEQLAPYFVREAKFVPPPISDGVQETVAIEQTQRNPLNEGASLDGREAET